MKNIAILGSTGSIGTQTIEVIQNYPDKFKATLLTAYNNSELLIQQALSLKPDMVVIGNPDKYNEVSEALKNTDTEVRAGIAEISECVTAPNIDTVVTAMVGYSGLHPTLSAIEAGKDIALANKETLVVAGDLIMSLAQQKEVSIYPVDSEHSALFQCLVGEPAESLEKIFLTASGGPFRGKTREQLMNVMAKDALKHPNWDMGAKVTIDSASLMNKGLEAIEAKWLFNLEPNRIDVLVHPQSVVHSMVQFVDGSVKAQLGVPDMRLPIQYALTHPERFVSDLPRCNFLDYCSLTFEKPDVEVFRNLAIAYFAMEKGGNIPCIMNAANEIAVDAFLKDKIKFLEIPDIIENTIAKVSFLNQGSLDDYCATDAEAREIAHTMVQ